MTLDQRKLLTGMARHSERAICHGTFWRVGNRNKSGDVAVRPNTVHSLVKNGYLKPVTRVVKKTTTEYELTEYGRDQARP